MIQLDLLVFAVQGEPGFPFKGGIWIDILVLLVALYLLRHGAGPVKQLIQRAQGKQLRPDAPEATEKKAVPKDVSVAMEEMFDTGVAKERRRYRRRWGNPLEVAIKTTEHPIQSVRGLVINRSERGVALLVDQSFPPKILLDIRSSEAPENIPSVLVRVRHCRSAGHNWMIGCQFQEEVPWNVLVWFG